MNIRTILRVLLFFMLSQVVFAQADTDKPTSLLGWMQEALQYTEIGAVHNLDETEGAKFFFDQKYDKDAVEQLYHEAEYAWDTVAYNYLTALWNIYGVQNLKAARVACIDAGKGFLKAKGTEQYVLSNSGLTFKHINHLREYLDFGEHKSTELLGFDSNAQTDVNGYIGYGTDRTEIPPFPWPAPCPSTQTILPNSFFDGANTLGDYDKFLSNSLDKCGYFEASYFFLPSGFVLVTRLERFDEGQGRPYQGVDRWNESLAPSTFSFRDYLSALFWGRKGYYRVIAFVVTDNAFRTSRQTPREKEVKGWLQAGGNRLPNSIANQPSKGFECTALVYEFELVEQCTEPKFLTASKIPAKIHIQSTGICTFK